MTKPNENKNENTLYAWATGDLASIAIGLAVGTVLYKSGIIQKTFGKFFGKDNTPFRTSSADRAREEKTE